MIKNYILVALRSNLKNKSFSIINIFGLTFSMAICLLVITVIINLSRSDQFHADKKDIYRLITIYSGKYDSNSEYASSSVPLLRELKSQYPIIEKAIYLRRLDGKANTEDKSIQFHGLYTNADFFESFDFKLVRGNHKDLDNPYTIFITERLAKKIFDNADPMGQSVYINDLGLFNIGGIIKQPDQPSHLRFELLCSFNTTESLEKKEKVWATMENWTNFWTNACYLKVKPGTSKDEIVTAINEIAKEQYADAKNYSVSFTVQNLQKISPGISMNNEIGFVVPYSGLIALVVVALIILSITGFNYLNLFVAKSVSRSKEIGLRKVVGSERKHITGLYITESIIMLLVSFLFAVLLFEYAFKLAERFYPPLNSELELKRDYLIYIGFLGFTIIIGYLFGYISSFRLSKLNPISVIKDSGNEKIITRMGLRKVLVTLQFIISTTAIIATILLFRQFQMVMNTDVGFNTENLMTIDLQGHSKNVVQNKMQHINGVQEISAVRFMPLCGSRMMSEINRPGSMDTLLTDILNVDENFIPIAELNLIAGRNFTEQDGEGNERYIIINELATKKLGYNHPTDAIGENITFEKKDVQIIGVVKDFQSHNPLQDTKVLVLSYNQEYLRKLLIKYNSASDYQLMTKEMKQKWAEIDPTISFEFQSYDEILERIYKPFTISGAIVGGLSLLAILISCLGLLGMVAYNAQSNKKDIGIHKVMGAFPIDIIKYLSRTYLKLVGIAICVSLILVYLGVTVVKMDIPKSIGFDIPSVVTGILIILIIVGLTIISQTWKASKENPVESLRYE